MVSQFSVPTKIFSGTEALSILGQYADKRVAIVTDAFMVKSGLIQQVTQYLGTQFRVFDQVKPDPDISVLQQGTATFVDFEPELFIALGGGSALDAAKGIRATYFSLKGKQSIPLIAIPTTSGSGSEVTSYAVISDPIKNVKYPLVSDDLVAEMAILDANLVMSVPKSVSMDTGMDVLTHAIEAYVSKNANDFSDALAEKTIYLVHRYLPQVFENPSNKKARAKVHNASCMAGMAFTSSGLGLVHGMAHTLGALFHIPHGKMNAMLLPIVIEFNSANCDYIRHRYSQCAKAMGLNAISNHSAVMQLVAEIRQLNQRFGIPESLRALGCDINLLQQDLTKVVDSILQDGCTQTNPRAVSADDVRNLLKLIAG
ncbi:alcohol dehydrogenase [Pasteurellaceae bacterium LFhippo2]|nr:alcohol dehydrogenase [Pasteurellaceae bacterium LFhippo2]